MKHSGLLGLIFSYDENEGMWIRSVFPIVTFFPVFDQETRDRGAGEEEADPRPGQDQQSQPGVSVIKLFSF